MDLFKDFKVLTLEQATVLPYLTYRLAQDGMQIVRLEHPVYGDPNRLIGENVSSAAEVLEAVPDIGDGLLQVELLEPGFHVEAIGELRELGQPVPEVVLPDEQQGGEITVVDLKVEQEA